MRDAVNKIYKLSTTSKVIFIIFLFLFISLVLTSIIYVQGKVFEGVRSYVRGEGLWAKAQKDAVFHLERYSYTKDEKDFSYFLKSVEVNLGDHNARLALDKDPPDKAVAKSGFIQGNNDPLDAESMIWFYLNFQSISYMEEAIKIWKEADEKIDELIALSKKIKQSVISERVNELQDLRPELYRLNSELAFLENRFSLVLGEGARWVRQTTWIASICVFLLFVVIGVWISRQIILNMAEAEELLMISESRFRSLNESNTLGIISWHLDGRIDGANDYFLKMLGFSSQDIADEKVNWKNMTPPEMNERDAQAIKELAQFGRCNPYEKVLLHKNGQRIPVYLGASLVDEHHDRGIAFFIDLSERKKSEEQLRLAAVVFDASPDGILITDANTRIISVNNAMMQMTGYDKTELIGERPAVLQSEYTSLSKYKKMWESLEADDFWQGDIMNKMKDTRLLPVHVSISRVKNSEGEVTHYVAIFSDIQERKAREEKLKYLANHDQLTGLSNRSYLKQRVEKLIAKSQKDQSSFGLLFFDLDKFKPVNDNYGHEVGDKLLQIVAKRLAGHIRNSDTVIRLGGDEFIILLEDINDKKTLDMICSKTVERVCEPCHINGYSIEVYVSVGASIYPENGEDLKSLLHHADRQMYQMKGHDVR